MVVLHVVNSLDPGGMENGIVNLSHALEGKGIEFHIACLERRGKFAERLASPERVTILGKGNGFSPRSSWRLARLIARLRPDIVHSHNLGPLIYAGLATLGGRTCVLLHGEHSQLTAEERSPRRLLQRRWLYRACRVVHTVSRNMAFELGALGLQPGKIIPISNGVDTRRFEPGERLAARRILGLPADAICIGIIGRFGPFKRHLELIDAFEKISMQIPAARLVIAGGGGSEEGAVTRRVEGSPVRERIDLLGFQSDPVRCYQALDLLAVPSANEGLSNAILEAMACAVPALARSGCGHEQIIASGEDGWIAEMETPDRLAAKLAEILGDRAHLVACGPKAREKVKLHFSIASMIDSYESLYRTNAESPR